MSGLAQVVRSRWSGLSPAARLGVGGVLALAAYFGMDDTTWRWAREWNQEAERLEHLLARAEKTAGDSSRAKPMILIHGEINPPRDESSGSQALAEAVARVMQEHRISNYSFEARQGSKLPSGAFRSALPAGMRVDRAMATVAFESSAEDAFGIIAALEASPDVDSIRSLSLDWVPAPKRVRVQLTAETWVQGTGAAGRRAR